MGVIAISCTCFCFSICKYHNTELAVSVLSTEIFYLIYPELFLLFAYKNYNVEVLGLETDISYRVASLQVDCDMTISSLLFGL